MANVLLVGAFGQGNPGDEALVAAFADALDGHDLVAVSGDPAATEAAHGIAAISRDARTTARAVRAADAVVVGGGTVFKRLHPSTRRRPNGLLQATAGLVAGARASGAKVAMIGVGADELRGAVAPRLARWIVQHVDLVVLRDEESAASLAAAGVPVPFWIGADPAWVLDLGVPTAAPGATVTVAISHLAGGAALVDDLAAGLAPLSADRHVRLQPWQDGADDRDRVMADELRARLDGRATVIPPPTDLADAAATFAGDGLVVALRFHALVAAARAGVPTVAIAHEPKLFGLSRRLGQLSVPAHATRQVLAAALTHGLHAEPAARAAMQQEENTARHSMALLELLLRGGELAEPGGLPALPLSTGAGRW